MIKNQEVIEQIKEQSAPFMERLKKDLTLKVYLK